MVAQAQDFRVVEIDAQRELTSSVILPQLEALLSLVRHHRAQVDAMFRADLAAGRPIPGAPADEEYPIGFCGPIRDAVFRRLLHEPLVQNLIAAGVLWKRIYFIQDASMFQNAIQCGHAILDVANDSVTVMKPPVAWYPLDSGFDWQNLENYQQTAAVAQRYYDVSLFPNRFFPLLVPLIPFVDLRADGSFRLFRFEHMLFFQDLAEGWPRLGALLAAEEDIPRPLPEAHQRFLEACQRYASRVPPPVELQESSPEEILALLPEWEALKTLPAARLQGALTRFDTYLRETNSWLACVASLPA